ncbi:hypothetical protein RPIT_03785 [Tessaracoccus flavus]|uniref:Histidine kinase/HSP90-like ATPase domain-containing protein n=1 Tax=Tessaracoccus flavus TaxID=1610493 RepID=A0A1Q2CD61_9ACTN|nr:hypothetical protein RPIT_03785 [Tessaracoccus flavus]
MWFRERHDMLGRVYTVVAVARSLLAAHAVAVNLAIVMPRAHNPAAVVAVSVAIIVWHTLITLRMRKAHRRTPAAHLADLGVTLAITLTTGLVVRPGGAPLSLAGYWIGGCAAYAAIFRSTRWGVAFAAAVAAVLVFTPGHFTMERLGSSFVILLFTACLGVLITQFRATLREQEQDRLRSAALAERERLSRIVHDGALQVLALVEREGPSLGPRGARLAVLARESEAQLRTLLQDREIVGLEHSEVVDLAAVLDKYQSARVTVSTMASGVMASRSLVDEVEAAVAEILTNVDLHAGADAQAWILLDQEECDEVILWVRDNGVGMSAELVRQAAESGRLGIRDSVVGRIGAVGGTATLRSSPGAGAEWELRVPINGERQRHSD